MKVKIYQPAKTAMQSGQAKTKFWLLEFEPDQASHRDPLMGWVGAGTTYNQVHLRFKTYEDAVAYAQKQGWAYDLEPPHKRQLRLRPYASNFQKPVLKP